MKKYIAILLSALSGMSATAQTSTYKNPVYGSDFPDPTVVRAKDGTFYSYATGCKAKRSTTLTSWTDVAGVISRPTWNDSIKADGTKDSYSLWAADVSYVDGKYVCYYASALWGNGSRTGIGVAVGDTPTKFTDKGKLFRSTEIGVENSIDPCYVEEFDKKYIVWGSFHDICIAELTDDALAIKDFTPINNPVSNPSKTRFKGVTKIAGGAFEGAMIYKRGSYYYLFCSVGSCCEGKNSTYRTVVGRSTSLKGPYKNKQGGEMVRDNYTTIISGDDRWAGPGHNSEIITDDNGDDWLLYHSYDKNNNYNGRLMLLDKITWSADGWPTVNDGHPSRDAMPAPVFYKGNGAVVTYKFDNTDLMKSGWKNWNVTASENCDVNSGRGSAFMPLGYAKAPKTLEEGETVTFDINQTVSGVTNGIYELYLQDFASEGNADIYVNRATFPAFHPAAVGSTAPSTETVISTTFLRPTSKFKQTVYGLVLDGKLTIGMRSRGSLAANERFYAGDIKVTFREKDPVALAAVLSNYCKQAEELSTSDKPFFKGFLSRIASYSKTAEATEDNNIRYTQLGKIHKTLDSIDVSMDAYKTLEQELVAMKAAIKIAEEGGYGSAHAIEVAAEAEQVMKENNYDNKALEALIKSMKTAVHDMNYAYQKGDGSKENPYVISRPDQLDNMHNVLIKDQMVYFEMDSDVDMKGYVWEQLNTPSSRYWVNLDGKGHIIRNLTPEGTKNYPSFFGVMCGEIRNVGFVDANVNSTGTGAAVIAGYLGHSTYKDAEDNLFPVIIENCYVTGQVTAKGYVGAYGGTLHNSPVFIRNCYSAVDITGNGSSANYSGGLVGRVRTETNIEKCYAAGNISSPVAGGVVAGGQNSTTPPSIYNNVIAWNKSVSGSTALPFGATIQDDLLSNIYYLADMKVNDQPVEEGKTHAELQSIAASWGAPWHENAAIGNGYPILQWQYERGDYRDICGFPYDPEQEDGIVLAPKSKQEGNADIYDLTGRKVSQGKAQKGIYIIAGKKVMK